MLGLSKIKIYILCSCCAVIGMAIFIWWADLVRMPVSSLDEVGVAAPVDAGETKKILYVDSYHREYLSGIAARRAFDNHFKDMNVEIRYEFMDAKRQKLPAQQDDAARTMNDIATQWQPDLIVAADDAANKYFIVPYIKGSATPVVFNGVNWDASVYGYPTDTITGQVEVELMLELIAQLRILTPGTRMGILTGDTLTSHKSVEQYAKILDLTFDQVVYVDNFVEWKSHFARLQDEVDILILRNNTSIVDWDTAQAEKFVIGTTKIPTGSVAEHLSTVALMTFPKLIAEFGSISADMVDEILFKNRLPRDMPLRNNMKSDIILNMSLAKKLNIVFPVDFVMSANLITP